MTRHSTSDSNALTHLRDPRQCREVQSFVYRTRQKTFERVAIAHAVFVRVEERQEAELNAAG